MKDIQLSQVERRQFIKRLTTVIGGTTATALVAGSGISSALAYQIRPNSAQANGKVFTKKQMQILAHIADTVLPKTDTPSGAELDCHGFVDNQLAVCFSAEAQEEYRSIVTLIMTKAETLFGRQFTSANPQQQAQLLKNIESLTDFTSSQKQQFKALKNLLIFGYFTTEIGATKALNFDPVPGGFKVIPYKKGDKSWGSFGFY